MVSVLLSGFRLDTSKLDELVFEWLVPHAETQAPGSTLL